MDGIRTALCQEYENNLRAERSKWERQMVQLRDDHEQALAEIKSKQKLRDSAEQQVLFNEALAKLKEENTEKDSEIKQLKSSLHLKSKGMSRLILIGILSKSILNLKTIFCQSKLHSFPFLFQN